MCQEEEEEGGRQGRPFSEMLLFRWQKSPTVVELLSCLTLSDPVDCNPPGSSVHGILQARILEWVAIPFSRGSSQPRDPTRVSLVSCIGRPILYDCAILEAPPHSYQGSNRRYCLDRKGGGYPFWGGSWSNSVAVISWINKLEVVRTS